MPPRESTSGPRLTGAERLQLRKTSGKPTHGRTESQNVAAESSHPSKRLHEDYEVGGFDMEDVRGVGAGLDIEALNERLATVISGEEEDTALPLGLDLQQLQLEDQYNEPMVVDDIPTTEYIHEDETSSTSETVAAETETVMSDTVYQSLPTSRRPSLPFEDPSTPIPHTRINSEPREFTLALGL